MSRFLQDCAEFIKTQPFDIIRITRIKDGVSETLEGVEANPCQNLYSVAKSFTMTAIGLLYDRGLVKPEDKVCAILKDELQETGMDPRWHDVTVDMALTHRPGLPVGFLDIDVNPSSKFGWDYLRYMLTYPLVCDPGTEYRYSDGAFYLLSRIASKVAGVPMDTFLWKELFYPLGFQEMAWSRCPMGYPMGATGLYIGSADMAKLGQLYLDRGVYGGKRILSEEWVDMALTRSYGFDWDESHRCFAKGGMCGQRLMVIPEDRLVVALQAYGANSDVVAGWVMEHSHED